MDCVPWPPGEEEFTFTAGAEEGFAWELTRGPGTSASLVSGGTREQSCQSAPPARLEASVCLRAGGVVSWAPGHRHVHGQSSVEPADATSRKRSRGSHEGEQSAPGARVSVSATGPADIASRVPVSVSLHVGVCVSAGGR